MGTIFYIYFRILIALGVFSVPLVVLQIAMLIGTITLIKKNLKAEYKTSKVEFAGIICCSILTIMLWSPLIFVVWTDMKDGYNHYFSIIKNWYIDGEFIIQSILLMLLSVITSFRISKVQPLIIKTTFCIYVLCELILTYSHIRELNLEYILKTTGGIALSVCAGNLIGSIILKIKKRRSNRSQEH